jgi:hypothetical protein
MCFTLVQQLMHNNVFFKEKKHYYMKEEKILQMNFALFFQFSFIY